MQTAKKKLEENLIEAKKMGLPDKCGRYFYKNEIKIPNNSFVLVCGTPGSGKSTVAQKICMKIKNISYVNIDYLFDASAKELYPKKDFLTEEEIDCIARNAFDKAYKSAKEAFLKERTVVWEDLGIFPTDRAEVLSGLNSSYAYAILVILNCDKLLAIFRSLSRGDTQIRTELIPDTYEYLQLQLQNPTKYFVGFDEVYIVDGTREVTVEEP